MKLGLIITSVCLIVNCLTANVKQQRRFPDDFVFGTATASYQIEGAWNEDGKGENIWDHLAHTHPEVIADRSNGDIAGDSYHNYKRDVEMVRELGLDAYRFSLSWTRILPDGFSNNVNKAGVDFYNNYINEMLKYNITPIATIYHWDLPQNLQDLGGFTNPLIVDWFGDYARVVFENFGDRVKLWITFNEPRQICYLGYGSNKIAPILNFHGIGEYLCAKNLVLSHARAYHIYNDEFKSVQKGVCGITMSVEASVPLTDSEADALAAELDKQAEWCLYTDPIFTKDGGFPKEISEIIAKKSADQGYPRSRLPTFTEEERAYAVGASDFCGVNHYSGALKSASQYKSQNPVPSLYDDIDVGSYTPPEWPTAATPRLKLMPHSLHYAITDMNKRYSGGNVTFYITENGWSTYPDADLVDDSRITYIRAALEDVLDILEEGVNLRGYMAWSLMDNFEWMSGYKERYGLYEVDFDSPSRTRTARKSAFVYKHIVQHRYIDYDYNPDVNVTKMTIDKGH